MGMVPLSFWLPFDRYREHHLDHHNDERLTDPLDDSESYLLDAREAGRSYRPLGRTLLHAQQTLAGRVVIGSFWRIAHFFRGELHALVKNDKRVRAVWIEHLLWCVPVILWLTAVCHMPLWIYIVAMVLPGNGVLLIRSFAEHRAQPESHHRTAIVERAWILGPLFLFNNLHALHHESPAIPWYEYNARYRLERERLIARTAASSTRPILTWRAVSYFARTMSSCTRRGGCRGLPAARALPRQCRWSRKPPPRRS